MNTHPTHLMVNSGGLSQSRRRSSEQGGMVILLALILITLMGVMTFSMSRDSFREIAITANESIGRKASEAADGGIDWTIMWGLGNGATPDQLAVRKAMDDLSLAISEASLRTQGVDATTNTKGTNLMSNSGTGILRAYVYPSSSSSTDLLTSNVGQTQSSVVRQAAELEIRYLGPLPLANTGALTVSKATGGGNTGAQRYFFLIRSTGRANVGGSDPSDFTTAQQSFIARRDAIVDVTF